MDDINAIKKEHEHELDQIKAEYGASMREQRILNDKEVTWFME